MSSWYVADCHMVFCEVTTHTWRGKKRRYDTTRAAAWEDEKPVGARRRSWKSTANVFVSQCDSKHNARQQRRAASSAGADIRYFIRAVKACWLRHEANKAETRAVPLATACLGAGPTNATAAAERRQVLIVCKKKPRPLKVSLFLATCSRQSFLNSF